MFRQMHTTPRQLHGRLRMALPRARAIQRLHPAPSAREHKAQRSCTVRQAVRLVSGSAAFTDVPADAYYADAAAWAEQKGITGGIGNGLFGPHNNCTRAQIVTFLYRMYGSK